jgi:hypothetical protein
MKFETSIDMIPTISVRKSKKKAPANISENRYAKYLEDEELIIDLTKPEQYKNTLK